MNHTVVLYCINVALTVSLLLMWWERGVLVKRLNLLRKEFNEFRTKTSDALRWSRRTDELAEEICEDIDNLKTAYKGDRDDSARQDRAL